jgi:outer membrane protein assembly factor BamB
LGGVLPEEGVERQQNERYRGSNRNHSALFQRHERDSSWRSTCCGAQDNPGMPSQGHNGSMKMRASRALMVLLTFYLATSQSLAAETNSWRSGGRGVAAAANPPILSNLEGQTQWKTALPTKGNASPVKFGSQVCITEEPVTIACFDVHEGRPLWSATNRYLDTLSGEEGQKGRAVQEQMNTKAERLRESQTKLSALQRDLRRSSSGPEVQQRYDALMTEVNGLIDFISANKHYLLPDDKGVMGYGTPTPTVIGGYLYVMFGNGVLSKFSDTGTRVWSIWLGAPTEPMFGYHTGTASSPLIVDGVLLAPFGKLRGIDPSNGSVLWEHNEWPHFGTSAVAEVDGQAVIITPAGDIIRPADGATIGPNLGRIEFIGPVADGDRVYSIGWTRLEEGHQLMTIGRAYQLTKEAGGRIRAEKLWERELSDDRTYASPLVVDDRIYVVYWHGLMEVLNAKTGEVLSSQTGLPRAKNGSPSAVAGSQRILIAYEGGEVQTFTLEEAPKLLGQIVIEEQLATPLLDGGRIYIRGMQHLYRIE